MLHKHAFPAAVAPYPLKPHLILKWPRRDSSLLYALSRQDHVLTMILCVPERMGTGESVAISKHVSTIFTILFLI